MMQIAFPADDMVWATAATRNATTWSHIDDHGLATIVKIKTGRKYWVVMCPKQNPAPPGSDGDMGSINAFSKVWQPWGSSHELWDHEAILLEAGDTLYVQCPILARIL
jgi:hypothetical protein